VKGSQPPELVLVIDLSASLYVGIVDPVKGVLAARIREQAGRLEKGSHAVSGGRGESGHALLEECLSASGTTLADIDLCGYGSWQLYWNKSGSGNRARVRLYAAVAIVPVFFLGSPYRLRVPHHYSLETITGCGDCSKCR
jgi:hypothetical protein